MSFDYSREQLYNGIFKQQNIIIPNHIPPDSFIIYYEIHMAKCYANHLFKTIHIMHNNQHVNLGILNTMYNEVTFNVRFTKKC